MGEGKVQESTCIIGTDRVTLLVTDTCHLRPDVRPESDEEVKQRRG
jgi:hypothetical protein